MRITTARAVLLAAGLAIAGTAIAQQQTLRIGVIAALSGPGAAWGNSVLGAVQMAAEDANAKGGLEVAGRKYRVDIVGYDDKYKAAEGLTAMNRLIFDDRVKIVVGPMGAAPALAALPVATENKVITLALGWSDKIMSPEYKYNFRPGVPSQVFAHPQVKWVVSKLGAKRVGALFPNDATGQDAASVFDSAYEAAGAKLVAKEFFERDRVDFVPLLTRVLSRNIDAFELDGNPPDTAGLLVKQLRELGFRGPIIATSADGVTEIVRIAGKEAADNLYVHQPMDVSSAAVRDYAMRYRERHKVPMNGTAPVAQVGMEMLFAAIQRAGTVDDTEKISDSMTSLRGTKTLLGNAEWFGQQKWGINHQLTTPFYVGVVRNGAVSIAASCTPEKCE